MTLHTGRFIMLFYAALMLIFVSCEDKNQSQVLPEGMGLVDCTLRSEIVVKSVEAISEDFDDYNFRFVGVDGYATSDYYRYGDIVWPMEWYFGLFRLEAESCTEAEAEAGYGKLRFAGIGQSFSVINDQLAMTSVVCNVANFRVNVNFNDKMFLSYKDFKLVVDAVLAPKYEEDEDGNLVMVRDEQLMRTLDFTTLNKVGFYNLHDDPMILKYTLYVMLDGASEYIEKVTGYLSDESLQIPVVVKAGDAITINVNYNGDVQPSAGIKFIVTTERKGIADEFEIQDYEKGSVTEDL